MKKNGLMKVVTVIATAAMMITAAGMTAAGAERENEIVSVSSERYVGGETISLVGTSAQQGAIAEVPVVMNTNNQCTSYNVLVEFDSRLDFVGVEGAKMTNSYEENGRKYVALVGYEMEPYQDGETVATIKLQVPEEAEEGEYEVKFDRVESFSNEYEDFANYRSTDAVITVVEAGCKGDANVDGKADVRDAALIAKVCANKEYANEITEMGQKLGDVDENQTINVRDAAKIARYVSKGRISWEVA